MPLLVETPEHMELNGPKDLSQRIIQAISKLEENSDTIDVVGIGSSIPGVVSAINLSSEIANVNIQYATLDYIPITVYGKQEAIFFELNREQSKTSKIVDGFEKKEEGIKNQQTTYVSRQSTIESITTSILLLLRNYELVRVLASGIAITMAVRSTLQVTKSNISREPVGLCDIFLEAIDRRNPDKTFPAKKAPAIKIYLTKGKETTYSARHKRVIEKIQQL